MLTRAEFRQLFGLPKKRRTVSKKPTAAKKSKKVSPKKAPLRRKSSSGKKLFARLPPSSGRSSSPEKSEPSTNPKTETNTTRKYRKVRFTACTSENPSAKSPAKQHPPNAAQLVSVTLTAERPLSPDSWDLTPFPLPV